MNLELSSGWLASMNLELSSGEVYILSIICRIKILLKQACSLFGLLTKILSQIMTINSLQNEEKIILFISYR